MRQRRDQRGQELTELGITILLMSVALGVIQFGSAWMVLNMVTHAARDGARVAASWVNRDGCQGITNKQPIIDAVNARIATVTAARTNSVPTPPTPVAAYEGQDEGSRGGEPEVNPQSDQRGQRCPDINQREDGTCLAAVPVYLPPSYLRFLASPPPLARDPASR